MRTFGIQYPDNCKFVRESYDTNLIGDKTKNIYYKTNDGTFSVTSAKNRYSAVQMSDKTSRFVTQDVRNNVSDDVVSAKVTIVGKKGHRCKSVQTLLSDGTYKVERFVNGVEVSGYEFKPVDRTFKGIKGFLEKAVVYLTTDINGCEKAKIAPIARKLIAKIRHF